MTSCALVCDRASGTRLRKLGSEILTLMRLFTASLGKTRVTKRFAHCLANGQSATSSLDAHSFSFRPRHHLSIYKMDEIFVKSCVYGIQIHDMSWTVGYLIMCEVGREGQTQGSPPMQDVHQPKSVIIFQRWINQRNLDENPQKMTIEETCGPGNFERVCLIQK